MRGRAKIVGQPHESSFRNGFLGGDKSAEGQSKAWEGGNLPRKGGSLVGSGDFLRLPGGSRKKV